MLEFTRLKKNIKKDYTGLKPIKVALLCDSASQFLHQALKGYGFERGFNYQIFEADYDQVERQIFDFSSSLYEFQPEFIIISKSTYKALSKFYGQPLQQRICFAENSIQHIENLINSIQSKLSAKIIFLNFHELNDGVFGNYSNKIEHSFLYQIRKLNLLLMDKSREYGNLFICDSQLLQSRLGNDFILSGKSYFSSDMTWSLDFLPVLAKNITDIIGAIKGVFKKCLIIDLDNTIWGGTIGDDGMAGIEIGELGIGRAFSQIQKWIKELQSRGVIICVCSKNTEELAREPFVAHPEMILRHDDIAVFVANWESKVDNIHYIQKTLNIGFDAMVFLDDSPYERNLIRTQLPEITVPELPEDPAEYFNFLANLNLFETGALSEEDASRTEKYREQAKRNDFEQSFSNEDEFLKNLQMMAVIEPFDTYNIPRAAQLTQRSNQFNLRTIRYSDSEIADIALNPAYLGITFKLKDKFGDSGLVSVVVLKEIADCLFIDTWVMSCRVLKRGMENFILNHLIKLAREKNISKITGQYLPTKKNGIVKELYPRLGFNQVGDSWVLDLHSIRPLKTFIVSSDKNDNTN